MINWIVQSRHMAIGAAGLFMMLWTRDRHLIKSARSAPTSSRTNRSRFHRNQAAFYAPSDLPLSRLVLACTSWLKMHRESRARRMLDVKKPLRQMLDMLPVPIVTVDDRQHIIFANARAEKLFGYGKEQLVGERANVLFPIHAGDASTAHSEGHDSTCPVDRDGMSRTIFARRRDGSSFPIEAETTTFKMSDQVLQITAISDSSMCTEVGRNPEDLMHLARVSSLGELAGSLAHELKQPLTAIMFNAQAARKFMDSENTNTVELREALDDIVTDNCRANDVIQKIRTLVRKGDIELQALDIGCVVHDVALLVHSDALTRGVRTSFDIPDNLAPVCGDRVQLQQVILNLLLNAFDAVSARGPADRVVDTTVRERADGNVQITVKDRGQGLSIDNMEKIFRPFYTTKPQGLGLGLSISRTIVTAHQGRLWAENNDGGGASFHLTLPRIRATASRTDFHPS